MYTVNMYKCQTYIATLQHAEKSQLYVTILYWHVYCLCYDLSLLLVQV